MRTALVRKGSDAFLEKLPVKRHDNDVNLVINPGHPGHKGIVVYTEMLLQICRDYRSLPDPRTMTLQEIRFFYDGLRGELREASKPRKQ